MDIFAAQSAKPMLIGGEGEAFDSLEYAFELKMDGERCLAYLGHNDTVLVNRRDRRVLPQFPELTQLHRHALGTCILDGELIVGTGSTADFELIKQRWLTRHPIAIQRLAAEHPAAFVAVDILYLDGRQVTDQPWEMRRRMLDKVVTESEPMAKVRVVEEHGLAFFGMVREIGLEGILGKRRDSVYLMGKRSRDWIKIKNWLEDEFVVCGYLASDKASVVSLVLGQCDESGRLFYRGRTTLGVNRDDFARVDALPRTKSHPFAETPPADTAGAIWLQPRLVCTVGFMSRSAEGRLRQPFYKHMRPDAVIGEIPCLSNASNASTSWEPTAPAAP